jgi:hypothetical protein
MRELNDNQRRHGDEDDMMTDMNYANGSLHTRDDDNTSQASTGGDNVSVASTGKRRVRL